MAETNSKQDFKPIYVIAGKDAATVDMQCDKLINSLLSHQDRSMALFNADPDTVTISQIFDELRTLPFLTDKRVVLLKNADDFITADNRSYFENYFKNPCKSSVLVMTVSSWRSNTKLAKQLTDVGELINAEPPKPWQLPAEIVKYAKQTHKKNISTQSAQLLLELLGENLPILQNEIDKLALLVGENNSITSENIESLTGRNRVFNVFGVIDSALTGQTDKAISRLRNMFASDKSAEFTAVGAFEYQLNKMFKAKAMLNDHQNPIQIATKLGIFGNKENFFRIVGKLSQKQIGDMIQKLAETDFEIKTGQTTAKVAIEKLVLKLSFTQAKTSSER
ncbi:MAG TPA: DNA polymerase III subunit delta [Sedimentisphaerales bacterium]|nr:DNA polymerase III subunit delta [Sedimentisphaerales bacterium]